VPEASSGDCQTGDENEASPSKIRESNELTHIRCDHLVFYVDRPDGPVKNFTPAG